MRVAVLAPSPWSETSMAMIAHLVARGYPPVGVISLPTWHWTTIRRKTSQWGLFYLGKYAVRKIVGRKTRSSVVSRPLRRFLPTDSRGTRSLYQAAAHYDFPILISRDLNSHACVQQVREWGVDLLVYSGGGILRENLIRAPRVGALNAHNALLPQIRGMGGPEWSLLLDLPIGVTVILMDEGIDTGSIVLRRALPLTEPPASLAALRNQLAAFEVSLMAEAVAGLDRGTLTPEPQSLEPDRQYFVVHDALKAAAERKLLRRMARDDPGRAPVVSAAASWRREPT